MCDYHSITVVEKRRSQHGGLGFLVDLLFLYKSWTNGVGQK